MILKVGKGEDTTSLLNLFHKLIIVFEQDTIVMGTIHLGRMIVKRVPGPYMHGYEAMTSRKRSTSTSARSKMRAHAWTLHHQPHPLAGSVQCCYWNLRKMQHLLFAGVDIKAERITAFYSSEWVFTVCMLHSNQKSDIPSPVTMFVVTLERAAVSLLIITIIQIHLGKKTL